MTTALEIEQARETWFALARVDTWNLPAGDPLWIAKCEAKAAYERLAFARDTQTPPMPLLGAGEGTPEILSTPASRALSVKAHETSPLRIVRKGSEGYWNSLGQKRGEQYEAAKARVNALKK